MIITNFQEDKKRLRFQYCSLEESFLDRNTTKKLETPGIMQAKLCRHCVDVEKIFT